MGTLKPHSNGGWYTGRWWVGCYIWYSEEGPGWAAAPPSTLLAVPNVTAHPSTASVPTSTMHYNCLWILKGWPVVVLSVWLQQEPDAVVQATSEAVGSDQRYLLCPAAVTIGHLKKYVKLKFALDHRLAVCRTCFHVHLHVSCPLKSQTKSRKTRSFPIGMLRGFSRTNLEIVTFLQEWVVF